MSQSQHPPSTPTDPAAFAATGQSPPVDPALAEIRERIAAAVAARRPLDIQGGNSKRFYGNAPRGEPLPVAGYRGIVAYEPTELVITARCGTPLAELRAALAEKRQQLACEPPDFGGDATVGGMMAAGLSGPRRPYAGSVRDFVLGACMLDGAGRWLAFGGQVMKNVAGYDVSRLLCGSLGVLGVITEVSLKVLPEPMLERSLRLAADEAEAIALMNQWAGRPLPISATSWHAGELHLRLSGARAAVEAACEAFGRDHGATPLADGPAHWHALANQKADFFSASHGMPLWRLSVPSTAVTMNFPGTCLIEWGGALRWLRTDAPAEVVRQAAAGVGGSAALFRRPEAGDAQNGAGVFDPLAPPLARIHARLKQAFDPAGVFNPGRLYPDL